MIVDCQQFGGTAPALGIDNNVMSQFDANQAFNPDLCLRLQLIRFILAAFKFQHRVLGVTAA